MRLFTLLLLTLFVSCGNDDDAGNDKVIYGGSSWYGHAPVWAGLKLGIFEKHGFDLTVGLFPSSSDRLQHPAQERLRCRHRPKRLR